MLFVHIGTHKTGTSALQSAMTVGADDLFENRIRYIKAGREGAHAHHKLAQAVRGKKGVPLSAWDPVRAELDANAGMVNILSSEGLWFAKAEDVKQQLSAYTDVRIVLYLRRQDKYLQSLYKQVVAGGRAVDFESWLERYRFRGDYLSVVQQWAERFGRDALIVRPYERAEKTVDVVKDFFEILGFDAENVLPNRKPALRNPSPRKELMELLLAFNRTGADIDRDGFFASIMRGKPAYARSADLLSHDECRTLLDGFAESNRILSENYYSDPTEPLFSELVLGPPVEYWQPGQAEYSDMLLSVMNAVVDAVSGQSGPHKVEKQKKKKRDSKAGRSADV